MNQLKERNLSIPDADESVVEADYCEGCERIADIEYTKITASSWTSTCTDCGHTATEEREV